MHHDVPHDSTDRTSDHATESSQSDSDDASPGFMAQGQGSANQSKPSEPRKRAGPLRFGSHEYYRKCTHPDGVSTAAELATWPERQLQRLLESPDGHLKKARVESVFGAGRVMHSYFSGELGAEAANRMQHMAMCEAGWNIPANNIQSHSACDCDDTILDATLNARLKPMHLYPSIQKCLPNPLRAGVEKRRPIRDCVGRKRKITADEMQAHRKCYADMDAFLGDNAAQLEGEKRAILSVVLG